MAQGSYGLSVSIGGIAIQKSIVRTADHPNPYEVTLPAAKGPLTSWVKTDANTAAGNLPGGHGYSNGKFDVYWSTGKRLDVDGTISTNALSLDGGSGDDFPASATADVVAYPQVTINTAIDGDAIKLAAISLEYTDTTAASRGRLLFEDSAGDDIASVNLTGNSPLVYDVEGGQTNPFTGDPITVCRASHENLTYAATLKIASLEDSTP